MCSFVSTRTETIEVGVQSRAVNVIFEVGFGGCFKCCYGIKWMKLVFCFFSSCVAPYFQLFGL